MYCTFSLVQSNCDSYILVSTTVMTIQQSSPRFFYTTVQALLCAFVCLILSASLVWAADIALDYFTARSNGKDIRIEWKTSREDDVTKFEIERALAGQADFRMVGSVVAKGSGTAYTFIDENAMVAGKSSTVSATLYTYRIKAIGQTSTTISQTVNVSHTVSSVRRTWGMIKEMFR